MREPARPGEALERLLARESALELGRRDLRGTRAPRQARRARVRGLREAVELPVGRHTALEPQVERHRARVGRQVALPPLPQAAEREPRIAEHGPRGDPGIREAQVPAAARLGLVVELRARSPEPRRGRELPPHVAARHGAAHPVEARRHRDHERVIAGADVVAERVVAAAPGTDVDDAARPSRLPVARDLDVEPPGEAARVVLAAQPERTVVAARALRIGERPEHPVLVAQLAAPGTLLRRADERRHGARLALIHETLGPGERLAPALIAH